MHPRRAAERRLSFAATSATTHPGQARITMTELIPRTLQPHYPPDALGISAQLDAAEERALSIVRGLTDAQAVWRVRESRQCVGDCLERYCTWLRQTLPVLEAGVRGVRGGWRARRGVARRGWWWRLFPRLAEFGPELLRRCPAADSSERRPLRQTMAEVLALHAEVRRIAREEGRRDLRPTTVQLPGMGALPCPFDVALSLVPTVFRRYVRRAERVRLAADFPRG
jgi:hypothetical protein